jgi:hypothetical protein
VPRSAWTGEGPRPILGFAVGTQGLADRCAPSRLLAAGAEYESAQIAQALARGWAVAVTDYPGLGTRGDHTYVVNRANGQAVLDAVRAARRLRPAGLSRRGPVGIYGYSEGGGAAGSAIEIQPAYAPDVRLQGAFVGAAPADFKSMLDHVDGSAIAFLLGYAAVGYEQAYPAIGFDRYLTEQGREVMDELRHTCIWDALAKGLTYPKDLASYFTADPFSIPSVRRRFQRNALGRVAPHTRVLLGAARGDEVIPYPIMTRLHRRYCALGVAVRLETVPLAEHVSGAVLVAPTAMGYLADRFAGRPARADC